MKISKKILSAALSAALLLTLTACSDGSAPSNPLDFLNPAASGSTTSEVQKPQINPDTIAEAPAEDFEYEYNKDLGGVVINKYIGSKISVKIPASIEGFSVAAVGVGAFAECKRVAGVIIPDGVKTIETAAFFGSGLTYAIIPDSVTTIGDYAFNGCARLTSITIPNRVTRIGEYAFSGCTGLTSITIPNRVTEIGVGAFYGCKGLTSISIPKSVTTIGEDAFWGCTGLDLEAVLGENEIFSEYVLDSKIVSANTLASNIKNRVNEFFSKMDTQKATYVGGVQTFTLTAVQTANGSDWVLSGSSAAMWKDGVDHANSNPVNTKNVTTRDTQLAAYIADTLTDMKQCVATIYIGADDKVIGVAVIEG